jgi:hypothetical protein
VEPGERLEACPTAPAALNLLTTFPDIRAALGQPKLRRHSQSNRRASIFTWIRVCLARSLGSIPVGWHSALRLLSIEQGVIPSIQNVSYTIKNETKTYLLDSATIAYYLASLLSAPQTKDTPTDLWGNPKLPLLESLGSGDNHGWSPVRDATQTLYSSLIGKMHQGLCSDCNATFRRPRLFSKGFGVQLYTGIT